MRNSIDFIIAGIAFVAAIVGAIIGGYIGARATSKAIDQSFRNDLKKREMERLENLRGLYNAIKSELEALWSRYSEGAGKEIESLVQDQPLLVYYPLTQDYFTVYQSNAHLIGEIDNEDLRALIILAYTAAKGVVSRNTRERLQRYKVQHVM